MIFINNYLWFRYHQTERLNEKSDVYSFGVVLLELITGKAATVKMGERTGYLVQWAIPIVETGDINLILDERLQQSVENSNSVWRVIDTAMACVKPTANERPTMSLIVAGLKECLGMVIQTEQAASLPDDLAEMCLVTSTTQMAPEPR